MPVVINEFEALAGEPTAAPSASGEAAPAGSPQEMVEPCAVASVLRILEEQAVRAWAH